MKKIFSYIFIFIFVFLTCYFNVSAVELKNYGGIEGYASNQPGKYECKGKIWGYNPGFAGVIEIAENGSRDPYYCADCKVKFPSSDWDGSNQLYSYESTGYCYYTCDELITESYATTQHKIWDLMKLNPQRQSCNVTDSEVAKACNGGTLYILTEYEYSKDNTKQKVVKLSSRTVKKGNIKVNKVCETGVSETFEVGIYKDGTFLEDVGTKEISCGGNVTFDLPVGNYTIKEINPDSKYNVEYSSSSVTVKANETSEVTVTNSLKPGKIIVKKECTGYINKDQKFKITLNNETNNETKEFSCNTSYTWDNLTPGDYTLTEDVTNLTKNLVEIKIGNNAFITGDSTNVKVLPNEEVKAIVKNTLEAGGITLTKLDADTNKPIEGVKFSLYFINGNNEEEAKDIYGNLIGIQTTTKEGKVAFQNLPYGKYKIVEVENPEEGYVIAESQTIIIDKDNAYYKSNFENKRIKLIINKTNIDGSKELENAKFNILDKKTKETYKEIEITKDNKTLILKPGEYIITEVVAPTGYQKLFDTIEIKVDNKGKITLNSKNDYVTLDDNVLTIKNDTRKVSISKADITTNKELEGAELVLIKKTGETEVEVIKWTSTKTPYRIELEAGTYILKELKVPTGYKNDPIVLEFSVDENGVVTIISEISKYYKSVDNEITIYNEKPIDVPDTGKTMKVVLIVVGTLLIGGGSYLTFKYGKRKEY